MRSAATSEFEDFGQGDASVSEQTGFDDLDIDNDAADDEDLGKGSSNKKVHTFSMLIITIQSVYCYL
jgi:hypothetical protein